MAAGGLSALIHAFFSIHLGANQIISGTAINILALGVTSFAYRSLTATSGTPDVDRIPNMHLPLISDIPFFGDVIGDLNLMVWVMFALVVLSWVFLHAHRVGPAPAVGRRASAGRRHRRHQRLPGPLPRGHLERRAGGHGRRLPVVRLRSSFNENMTAGRGFIALAALVFGNWRPFGVLWAALLFGFASALANSLQTAAGVNATS